MSQPVPKRHTIAAGLVLMRQGERGDRAWLIESGELEILLTTPAGTRRLGTVGRGAVVGEMALIDDGARSATVRALTEVACVEVTRDAFRGLLKKCPPLASYLLQSLIAAIRRDYGLPTPEPMGGGADIRSTNSYQKIVDRRMFRQGYVFFHPGETAAAAYLIQSGQVSIERRTGERVEEAALLGPGQMFGELAVMTGRPQDSVAVAAVGTICEVIRRESLLEVLATMPPILRSLAKIYVEQLARGRG